MIKMVFIIKSIQKVINFKTNIKFKLINISKKRLIIVITKMPRLGKNLTKVEITILSLRLIKKV